MFQERAMIDIKTAQNMSQTHSRAPRQKNHEEAKHILARNN